jgi:hypothetical protein
MSSRPLESHVLPFRATNDALESSPDDDLIDTGVRRRDRWVSGVWRLRCLRRPSSDSIAALLPALVTVHPDGTALAHYPGAGMMHFTDLAHLMAHHELTIVDFEEEES